MKWLVLFLFGIMGAVFLIAGLVWGSQRQALYKRAERAAGQVVALYESENTVWDSDTDRKHLPGRRVVTYYPVVVFTAPDGRQIRFRSSTSSNVPDYEVGQRVEVLYDPASPDRAELSDFTQFWLGPLALTLAGFAALGLAAGGFLLIGQVGAREKAALQR